MDGSRGKHGSPVSEQMRRLEQLLPQALTDRIQEKGYRFLQLQSPMEWSLKEVFVVQQSIIVQSPPTIPSTVLLGLLLNPVRARSTIDLGPSGEDGEQVISIQLNSICSLLSSPNFGKIRLNSEDFKMAEFYGLQVISQILTT